MQVDNPVLFVEINLSNYIFVAGIFDEKKKFKIINKTTVANKDIKKNKFINLLQAQEVIKNKIEIIEQNLNYVFKEVILILDDFDFLCLNISGYKKLNGSQVLKENIFYILNSLKSAVSDCEQEKTILHIFNSKSSLDDVCTDDLPIGLFGNFYYHELSFFLINNNDLKNINQIFNKNNLNIKKILLKKFVEGAQLINENKNNDSFINIKIGKDYSNIYFFEKSSFKYLENFSFGTNIIFKDIMKVCSINYETIQKFFSNTPNNQINFANDEFLEEKYFTNENFRKIRKKLIIEIANARIDEIINIIFSKNINLRSFRKTYTNVYLNIEDKIAFNNFEKIFKSCFSHDYICKIDLVDNIQEELMIANAAKLSTQGWTKEAVPVVQTKNSLITRIFKSLFG